MTIIITDASACITRSQAANNSIIVMPLSYSINGAIYEEKYLDEAKTAYTAENLTQVKTTSNNPEDYVQVFSKLTQYGYDVVCITVSQKFSNEFKHAMLAKEGFHDKNVQVIDSGLTAGGLRQLAEKAADFAKETEDFDLICKRVEDYKKNIGIVFSVDDMDILRNSGRVGRVASSVNTILNIRPILICKDGEIEHSGVSRGQQLFIQKMLSIVPKDALKVILHVKEGNRIISSLLPKLKERYVDVEVCDYGNIIPVHLGLGAVGIAWVSE